MNSDKQEHEFLNRLLIEVYNADFTKEQLDNMTTSEKKAYIKKVSVICNEQKRSSRAD